MGDSAEQPDAGGSAGCGNGGDEVRALRTVAGDQQGHLRQRRDRRDDEIMALQRNKVTDADDEWPCKSKSRLRGDPVRRLESIQINAGIVDCC